MCLRNSPCCALKTHILFYVYILIKSLYFQKLAQVDHNGSKDTGTFCGVGKTTLSGSQMT